MNKHEREAPSKDGLYHMISIRRNVTASPQGTVVSYLSRQLVKFVTEPTPNRPKRVSWNFMGSSSFVSQYSTTVTVWQACARDRPKSHFLTMEVPKRLDVPAVTVRRDKSGLTTWLWLWFELFSSLERIHWGKCYFMPGPRTVLLATVSKVVQNTGTGCMFLYNWCGSLTADDYCDELVQRLDDNGSIRSIIWEWTVLFPQRWRTKWPVSSNVARNENHN